MITEKLISCCCCCWKISSKEIALAMMVDDLEYQQGSKEKKGIRFSNSEIKAIAQRGISL